jgi:hypothetical protein
MPRPKTALRWPLDTNSSSHKSLRGSIFHRFPKPVDGGKIAFREVFLINGRLFDGLQSRARKQHGIRRDHSIERRIDFGTGRSGMGAGNEQCSE